MCVHGYMIKGFLKRLSKYIVYDKVLMYKEIMMNDDSLESKLLTSSLLKICCLVQDLLQVEL